MIINRDQLKLQIDRLVDVFGDKNFSEQRELMIWEAVDGLDYFQVVSMVDNFIRSSDRAPKPSEFSECARGLNREKTKYSLGEERPDGYRCADCRDSGQVHVSRIEGHESWAKAPSGYAPCHCDRGRQAIIAAKRTLYPTDLGAQYGPHWESSYRILRGTESA